MASAVHSITIDGVHIEVHFKKIKNLHLGVYPPAGSVRVSAPQRMDTDRLRAFLTTKLPWIKKHQARFQGFVRAPLPKYVSREPHHFKGRTYLLNVINHNGAPRITVNENSIYMYIKEGASLHSRKTAMAKWYREQLKRRIPAFMEKWQKQIGVEATSWGVKQMKTRWGSCSVRARRIWINLEFAKKADEYLDYIIVHELLHLIERGHNARFKALMDRFIPDWRGLKAALNNSMCL